MSPTTPLEPSPDTCQQTKQLTPTFMSLSHDALGRRQTFIRVSQATTTWLVACQGLFRDIHVASDAIQLVVGHWRPLFFFSFSVSLSLSLSFAYVWPGPLLVGVMYLLIAD
jgi:hypothetical protein